MTNLTPQKSPQNNFKKNIGCLYIVATPIGNLSDFSIRAQEILKTVNLILCEDTRQAQKLLNHYGIQNLTEAFHEHNERELTPLILQKLISGQSLAFISDAGTPLISDPGWFLVREAQNNHIRVIPIPGPCALIAALSVSGLPTHSFCFQGFLPHKKTARIEILHSLSLEPRTLIFYEAPHRILETLEDMIECFGSSREALFARELTKLYETIRRDSLNSLYTWIQQDSNQQRGEIVLIISGAKPEIANQDFQEADRILKILLKELPLAQAAQLTSKITNISKRTLYERGLLIK